MNTCVIVPTNFSKYSLAICSMLFQKGIKISLIICPSATNLKRIKTYWKREKIDFIRKIWYKILFRNKRENKTALDVFCNENNISAGNISDWAKQNNIRFMKVHDLNTTSAANIIMKEKCDLGVFTGGGLIRSVILNSFSLGILNGHRGILPQFRGMDTHIWSEWEKQPAGLTLHYMDIGIDTGPILLQKKVLRKSNESIALFEERLEIISVKAIIESVMAIKEKEITSQPQDTMEGKQYYVLHKRLRKAMVQTLENQ